MFLDGLGDTTVLKNLILSVDLDHVVLFDEIDSDEVVDDPNQANHEVVESGQHQSDPHDATDAENLLGVVQVTVHTSFGQMRSLGHKGRLGDEEVAVKPAKVANQIDDGGIDPDLGNDKHHAHKDSQVEVFSEEQVLELTPSEHLEQVHTNKRGVSQVDEGVVENGKVVEGFFNRNVIGEVPFGEGLELALENQNDIDRKGLEHFHGHSQVEENSAHGRDIVRGKRGQDRNKSQVGDTVDQVDHVACSQYVEVGQPNQGLGVIKIGQILVVDQLLQAVFVGRRPVNLIDMGVFNEAQEHHLQEVTENGHHQHRVRFGNEGKSIVPNVTHRVHGVRKHLKHAIKDQIFVVDLSEEEIAPVPRIVLNGVMSIDFDPQVEQNERDSNDNSSRHRPNRLSVQKLVVVFKTASNYKTHKRSEVQHQDQINDFTENQPCVEIHRVSRNRVLWAHLGPDLHLSEMSQLRQRILLKQTQFFSPPD